MAILALKSPAFHWKIFVRFVTERPPFLRNLSPKDPLTSEVSEVVYRPRK